jgi:ferritin
MAIIIDARIKRFVEGCLLGENNETISIRLKDIDETFWFENEVATQEFLNRQVTERVADKELRKGYFDYIDEYGDTHRYFINEITRGKIISFTEKIIK